MASPGFPALMGLTPAARDAAPGEAGWALPPAGVQAALGTDEGCALVVRRPLVARRQCVLERVYGRTWVRHLGDVAPTRLNGERVQDAPLSHRDVLELPGGLVFRYLERPDVEAHSPVLEAQLLAHPDDDARWAVWADWLQEQGDALGERVLAREPFDPADTARLLGPLASLHARGRLELRWYHGLPYAGVVRQRDRWLESLPETAAAPVTLLREARACRFLRALEVDVASFGSGAWVGEHLAQVLVVLAQGGWPLLETLQVGPVPAGTLEPRHARLLDEVRAALPRLKVTAASLCFDQGPPSLECLAAPHGVLVAPPPGEAVPLSPGVTTLVGQTPECAVRVLAPPGHPCAQVALRVACEDGQWWLTDLSAEAREVLAGDVERPLRINGRPGTDVQVRGGDLVEAAPGLLFRFLRAPVATGRSPGSPAR